MLKVRVIPCLDVKDGRVVKGVNFLELRDAGDPVEQASAYDAAGADELMFLDITASSDGRRPIHDVIARTAAVCFMPLSVGGGVRSVGDARELLLSGADKVSINTAAVENPDLLSAAADAFGSQCVVAAVDVKAVGDGRWEVFTYGGRKATGLDAVEYAALAVQKGAGEILPHLHGPRRGQDRLRHAASARHHLGGWRAGDRLGRRRKRATPGGGGDRRRRRRCAGGLHLPLRRGGYSRGQGGHGGGGPARADGVRSV